MALSPEVLARHDLLSYCRLMQPDFRAPPHLRLLAARLEAVEAGKIKRLIVSLPPRHGKSNIISKLFPSWYLGRHPIAQVINATHTDDLAVEFGREVRDFIQQPQYQQIFPGVACKQDSQAAGRFHIEGTGAARNGVYKCFGRRGKMAGWGADLALLDDLLAEGEEYSEAAKVEAHRAVRKIRTRLMPDGAMVFIMSRCAEDDPVGYVLKDMAHEGWEVLALPAIADEPERHILPDGGAWTRQPGDPLWPEQYSLEALEALRMGMPIHEWSAKYQRKPIPMGSRLVEEEWFADRRYDDDPDDLCRAALRIVISGDTSKGTATGARTALGVWAELPRGAHLVEVAAERWHVPVIIERLFAMAGERKPHIVLIEDKSTGEGIIQTLRADPNWKWPIEAIMPPPGMDKIVRFSVSTPPMKSGQMWLPRKNHPRCAHWQPKYELELFTYPNCADKDQGDMTSQYLNWRRENPLPLPVTKSLGALAIEYSALLNQEVEVW